MIELEPPFRFATPGDAPALAELINFAGEGLPLYLWTKMAEPGETPWEVGRRRAWREVGSFSYRNAVVAEVDGSIVASLVGYPLPDTPEPIDYDRMPPMFVPLQELENLAPRTWYANVLATYPQHRGQGYGTRLLGIAERLAAVTGRSGLSIIVSDANAGARRLYERCGYRELATRPMVRESAGKILARTGCSWSRTSRRRGAIRVVRARPPALLAGPRFGVPGWAAMAAAAAPRPGSRELGCTAIRDRNRSRVERVTVDGRQRTTGGLT